MAGSDQPIVFADARGGQNSADPPHDLGPTQVTAATNVEWYRATLARKRQGSRLSQRGGGSSLPSNKTFSTLAGAPHVVTGASSSNVAVVLECNDLSEWLSWGWSATPSGWRTASSAPDTQATHAALAYFNGKWFAAYNSSVDRLHYLSLSDGGFSWYRAGLAAPSTPTITESAGAVTDNRKYRSVVCYLSGSTYFLRSEPSTETSVRTLAAEQASAAAPGAAPANELYNSWELQVASDDDNYATWWIVGTAGATTAIVDNNASVFTLEPAPELGLHEPPHSARYLGVDDNRLLMAGAYEDTTDEKLQQRVWFTPVLGDLDIGDDQRIPDTASGQRNWVDIDAGDAGGPVTGFGPPTLGDVLVFKRFQLWRLVRTGLLDKPYLPRRISGSVGTFGYRTVCAGEDAQGQPCVYFAASRGPYRVGVNGVEYLGAAIEDVWAPVNRYGDEHVSQHAVYYPDKGQYWLWVSTGANVVPSILLVYSVRSGGWASYTGPLTTALCSALLPRYISENGVGVTTNNVFTAPSVPYCCPLTNGQIAECDAINPQTGVALDTDLETYSGSGSVWSDGTAYAASLTTRPLTKPLDGRVSVTEASVFADAASGVSLQIGLLPDYDSTRTRVASVSLTAEGSGTRVLKRVDGAQYAAAKALQVTVGDASAVASQWTVHAVQVRATTEADR